MPNHYTYIKQLLFKTLIMTNYSNTFVFLLTIILLTYSCDSEDTNPLESDITPPSIEISFTGFPNTSEETAIFVSQQLEIKIDAEDANGIDKIEAFIDNQKISEDTTPPFLITIDISGYSSKSLTGKFKDYTLKVSATDKAGNVSSKEQLINIDNEIPMISEVSLQEETILGGNTNAITFKALDNEGIARVNIYVNDNLITEITEETEFEVNLDTSTLSDGENKLKIEAIDLAENKAFFEVNFISDNSGPEINLESITNEMIIDQSLTLNPEITDLYSDITSVEIKFNDESLIVTDISAEINYKFDPETFGVGEGAFTIIAIDTLGNTTTLEIPVNIYRRLITINIPENRLNPAIIFPVVFISRMDGSLVVSKEILRDDRQIILNTPEEFDATTEFMLSFYLQDNGNATGISTHQNLTRNNPKILNLAEPIRPSAENGFSVQIPTVNFLSNDILIGQGGKAQGSLRSLKDAESGYTSFLNTTENYLNLSTYTTPQNTNQFNSFYVYEPNSYQYLVIDKPIREDYILDKANFSDTNLESRELVVNSTNTFSNTSSYLGVYGTMSQEENDFSNYNQIYHFNRGSVVDSPMQYYLNNSFNSYIHTFRFGNYFTERKGAPLSNYQIPNVTFDYTFSNNQIDLSVQGNDHVVGRAQCIDIDGSTFGWYVTFNSKDNDKIIIPELPDSIIHPVATAHTNGTLTVEKVELISYQSILTYDDYIQKVIKNQTNILKVSDWYQLIYSSRTGNFNGPSRSFTFQ